MTITPLVNRRSGRSVSVFLSLLLMLPLFASCGRREASVPPPVDDTRSTTTANNAPGSTPEVKKHGLSNAQKGAIVLAGAAALYYLYQHHKHAQAQAGPNGKYYLSKNGRVYYRDAEHRAHWVTPPPNGIQVPAEEAQQYREFQGYNNQQAGRDLTSVPEAQSSSF